MLNFAKSAPLKSRGLKFFSSLGSHPFMSKKLLSLYLFLLITSTSFAQLFTISGTITDDAGSPVPFASIVIRNTTKGTSANNDGNYSLSIAPGQYEVLFKAIGYRQETRQVNIKANVVLNIKLAIASYQLKDVVVRPGGEDPAYAIIRKAIRKRKTYLNEVNAYNCTVYVKGLQKLLDAPKKFLGRDVNQIAREYGLDSNRRGIVYLSESQSKLSFEKPDKVHEEMISSKVSGSNRAFSFNRASDIKVNIYENYQDWQQISNRPFISPIADNALSYYNYKWLGTIQENGETINKIQLIPKHAFEATFSGTIYIIEDTWRVHSFDVQITKSANLNIVDTLKVKEQYVQVSKKAWMPSTIKMEFTGGFFGFKFGGYVVAVYSNYELGPVLNKKEFAEVLRIPNGVNKKDSVYWEQERPVPLTDEEITDYKKKAILAKKRESKPYLDSLDRVSNHLTANKFLLTGYLLRNRYKKQYLYLNPVIPSFLYNTVEGFTLNYGARFVKQIDSASNKFLRLGGNIRYGIADKRLHANVEGTIPLNDYTLNFAGGSGVYDLNDTEPTGALFNTINSLLRRNNILKLYEKTFASAGISHRIAGSWRAGITTEYADRTSLENSTSYSIFKPKDKNFTSNNPFTPTADVPLFLQNQSFTINIHSSYNFSNKYVTYPSGRYYLPSGYPTLTANFTKGFKNVFGSDVDYNLLTASLSKEGINMGVYGKSAFYIGAGKFFNNKQLTYVDYEHFYGTDGNVYSVAPNRFLLLDIYRHSTPDKFFEAHYEHNFSGYLLNNIPGIRKLKLQEIINLNYLTTPTFKNYFEVVGGVQYLNFRLMYGFSSENRYQGKRSLLIGIILPERRGFR